MKTSGVANSNPGDSGTSAIIYHRGNKVSETKHYVGQSITNIIAEYISLIIGLQVTRNTFRRMQNKILIINIKSHLAVN